MKLVLILEIAVLIAALMALRRALRNELNHVEQRMQLDQPSRARLEPPDSQMVGQES